MTAAKRWSAWQRRFAKPARGGCSPWATISARVRGRWLELTITDNGPGFSPEALTRATDWVWITGNHDAAMAACAGGTPADELEISGVVLRHRALPGERRPELSGHFHPKVQLRLRDRPVRRACAVVSRGGDGGERMILPAFGAFTGGMDAADPAIRAALQPARAIDAVVHARGKLVSLALWREAA